MHQNLTDCVNNLHYEKFQDGTVKCIEDEIPFEVPEGWAWCRLNDIYNFIDYRGATPTKTTNGIPLVTAKNVKSGYIDYTIDDYISEEEFKERQQRGISKKGDILFTTEAPLGNAALADIEKFSAGQRLITFQQYGSKNELINYVMLMFILSDFFQQQLCVNKTGSTVAGIKAAILKTLWIPVPPYKEQLRISNTLKSAINLIDSISQNKEILSTSISNTKSKILDLAIRGKLVPQDPNDEPASVLLERIRAEKEELIKQGKIKRDKKESVIFRGDDNSYYEKIGDKVSEYMGEDLPLGWSIASFSQVNMFSAETIDPSHFPEKMFELYSVPNFELGVPEIIKGQEIGSSKQSICENDVLVCKINPRINRVWITRHITSYPILGSSEWVVFRNDYLYAPYMQFYFLVPYFRELLLSNVSGVGGSLMRAQPESVKKYPILVPPYKEQVRIAEKITELFIKFDDIEKSLS